MIKDEFQDEIILEIFSNDPRRTSQMYAKIGYEVTDELPFGEFSVLTPKGIIAILDSKTSKFSGAVPFIYAKSREDFDSRVADLLNSGFTMADDCEGLNGRFSVFGDDIGNFVSITY